jgi:hypothetical protein
MGHQAGDGLGRDETDVQGRADREGPAEVLGRVAVAAGTVVVMVVVTVRVTMVMIVAMAVVIMVVLVVVIVRHGVFSHQGRDGSTSQPSGAALSSRNRDKGGA